MTALSLLHKLRALQRAKEIDDTPISHGEVTSPDPGGLDVANPFPVPAVGSKSEKVLSLLLSPLTYGTKSAAYQGTQSFVDALRRANLAPSRPSPHASPPPPPPPSVDAPEVLRGLLAALLGRTSVSGGDDTHLMLARTLLYGHPEDAYNASHAIQANLAAKLTADSRLALMQQSNVVRTI